jgi:cell fate regulator YaaT (PSP1 superfamily)
MGCTNCGAGCSSGGCTSGCSSGGCNRLDVFDWFADLPVADPESECRIVEVSFNHGSRKDFYKNNTGKRFSKGNLITVEGVSGFDVGTVNLSGEIVRLQLKKKKVAEDSADIKRVLRPATESDIAKWKETKAREMDVLIRSRAIARKLNVNLKMSEVEIQADGKKATFFYIADERVDFRELIRVYATEFHVKVEMKQIGARQEAAKIGGIGSCGRELCSSTWLTCFKSVNTNAARYQNLSINQTKLSGQCGRLKNCLNFELDTYLDALQYFPDDADVLELTKGKAFLVKKDIFRNLMWYSMADSTKHYPLSIETVKKIQSQNRNGLKPETLETVEVISGKPKEVEPEFVDVVGQISLRSLEKSRKHKPGDRGGNKNAKSFNKKGSNHPQQKAQQSKNPKNQQNPAMDRRQQQRPKPPHSSK